MERAVAHEVADELGEVRGDVARHEGPVVRRPVRLRQWREGHLTGLADHAAERQRDAVAGPKIGEAPPLPVAVGVDDPDPVGGGALDPVAARGLDGDHRLGAVDVELRGRARSVVGGDLQVQVLPLLALGVAEALEADEASVRQDQAVADEAAGRREDGDLGVAVTVRLARAREPRRRRPERRAIMSAGTVLVGIW